ncbi:hypothetical protein E2C01_001323 [Portunus trituberculatus]|uniref:Uncharacterized protein n=1 Tax=Portunus trituberculatus TaxID=210409 RepID=A0A5B7CH06_PORTR|nr:hypothetical protein [Portunus trituberculatus]
MSGGGGGGCGRRWRQCWAEAGLQCGCRGLNEHHSAPRSPPCQTSPPPSFLSIANSVVMVC